MVGKLEVLRSDIVIQLFIVLAAEWEFTAEKRIQKDT